MKNSKGYFYFGVGSLLLVLLVIFVFIWLTNRPLGQEIVTGVGSLSEATGNLIK